MTQEVVSDKQKTPGLRGGGGKIWSKARLVEGDRMCHERDSALPHKKLPVTREVAKPVGFDGVFLKWHSKQPAKSSLENFPKANFTSAVRSSFQKTGRSSQALMASFQQSCTEVTFPTSLLRFWLKANPLRLRLNKIFHQSSTPTMPPTSSHVWKKLPQSRFSVKHQTSHLGVLSFLLTLWCYAAVLML